MFRKLEVTLFGARLSSISGNRSGPGLERTSHKRDYHHVSYSHRSDYAQVDALEDQGIQPNTRHDPMTGYRTGSGFPG